MNQIEIIKIFKSPGEHKQKLLIEKLKLNGDQSVKLLIETLNDTTSIEVKRWIVEAMGEFDTPESRKLIIAALKDKAMSVKLHAIRAVRKINDQKIAKYVLPLIDDESGGIRINALDVIFEFRVRGYKSIIEKCLMDQKEYVRKRATSYKNYLISDVRKKSHNETGHRTAK